MQIAANFTAFLTFYVPYANNTQHYYVTQDTTFQYWHAFNNKDQIIDSTLADAKTGYYVRTEKDHQTCQVIGNDRTTFVPKLSDFEDMGDEFLDQRRVRHFRNSEEFAYTQKGQTYNAVQELQQEFYCVPDDAKKYCTPVRWEMRSRSNFDSHQDVYIIYYDSFELGADAEYATPSPLCDTSSAKAVNYHTVFHEINDVLAIKQRLDDTEQLLQKMRKNKKFTFTVGHNKFSRMTAQQRKSFTQHKQAQIERPVFSECQLADVEVPEQLDWRVRGASTPVKDQVACGSCWTFAAAAAMESRINVLRNKPDLIRISEQAMVDCFWDQRREIDPFLWSQGCEGGQFDYVIDWFATEQGALPLESDYPYLGQNDYCRPESFKYTEYKVAKTCQVPPSAKQLKLALQTGPVAVAIGVTETLVYYTGGVFNDPECGKKFEELGHAVTAVGYAKDNQYGEYWIIKNSWSNHWGMDGYIYIAMEDNICGVLTDAAYPVMEKAH